MQRHEPQSLGDLLRKEIEESRSAPLLDEFKAVKAWPVVMGADIAAKTGITATIITSPIKILTG